MLSMALKPEGAPEALPRTQRNTITPTGCEVRVAKPAPVKIVEPWNVSIIVTSPGPLSVSVAPVVAPVKL